MPTFTTRQTRQAYVLKAYNPATASGKVLTSVDLSAKDAGNVSIGGVKKDYFYFTQMGKGGLIRSDIVKVNNIKNITFAKDTSMVYPLKRATIEFNTAMNPTDAVPGLIAGRDYIMNIEIRNFLGAGEAYTYLKQAEIHITSSDTIATALTKLLAALNKNNVEIDKFFNYSVDNATTPTKLFIDEVPQHWELGKFKQEHILFSVRFVPISYNGDTVIWGKTDTTGVNTGMAPITNVPNTVTPYQITNGKMAADLEWFCMGSRGDIYRQVGYPNNITTQYMVDPSKTYHYINIHYASKGDNVDIQEQEKDLTLMIEVGTVPTADINNLIKDINALTGSADGDSLYLTPLA
jgi:hypothetical protein